MEQSRTVRVCIDPLLIDEYESSRRTLSRWERMYNYVSRYTLLVKLAMFSFLLGILLITMCAGYFKYRQKFRQNLVARSSTDQTIDNFDNATTSVSPT